MEKDVKVKVTNRSLSKVIYSVKNLGVRREFLPGESIAIPYSELEALSFQPGGKALMANYLMLTSLEDPKAKSSAVEPEYYYGEAEITNLIKNGSLDEWLDMLDFAPVGVIDMAKELSITIPLNDVEKREALLAKTGYDVTAIINNAKEDEEDEVAVEAAPKRRVNQKQGRRTNTKPKTEE